MSSDNVIADEIQESSESWQAPHERAMECRDLEETLRRGLRYFRALRSWDETWSCQVQANPGKYEESIAREIRGHYERWYGPCDDVLKDVERMEREFPVEGAEEFRKARHFVKLHLLVPINDLVGAMKEVKAGKHAPLEEAMNELQATINRAGT